MHDAWQIIVMSLWPRLGLSSRMTTRRRNLTLKLVATSLASRGTRFVDVRRPHAGMRLWIHHITLARLWRQATHCFCGESGTHRFNGSSGHLPIAHSLKVVDGTCDDGNVHLLNNSMSHAHALPRTILIHTTTISPAWRRPRTSRST
jgi:hypothetical protein